MSINLAILLLAVLPGLAFAAPDPLAETRYCGEPRRTAADEADTAEAKVDAQVQMFLNFTLAQLDTWVETNITGAGNKTAFKVLGRLAQAAARGRVLR